MFLVRRVVGKSMMPAFRPGQVIVAWRLFRRLKPGDVVIIRHAGLEKIKRVKAFRDGQVFVLGDNLLESTDSRQCGWLPRSVVRAKLCWPNW